MAHVYGQALASDLRGHWLKFAIARFARLYPLFAVTTLFMVAVFVLFGTPLPLISLSGAVRLLNSRPLVNLGNWSYSIYLCTRRHITL